MPALIPILIAVLLSAVFRILVALGLGFVTFTYAVPEIYGYLQSAFTGLPPEVFAMIGILRLDICITLMVSAVLVRMTYKIAAAPLISLGG